MLIKFILPFVLFSVYNMAYCQHNNVPFNDSVNYAFIKFETKTFNLDTVKTNSTTQKSFKYVNTGKIPLIIKDIKSSCGCTVVSFSQKPVMPEKSNKIKFSYTAPKKAVTINKYLIVLTNTYERNYMLRIKGVVVKN